MTSWLTKIKENLLTAGVTTIIALLGYGTSMMLDHDKKLALLDQKVTILIHVVAPQLDVTSTNAPAPIPTSPLWPQPDMALTEPMAKP